MSDMTEEANELDELLTKTVPEVAPSVQGHFSKDLVPFFRDAGIFYRDLKLFCHCRGLVDQVYFTG
jgi:hypothetical protein